MIKNYSINTKLIILFVVTFFLVCVLFIILLKIEGNIYNKEESFKQENLIKSLLNNYKNEVDTDLKKYLINSGFNMVKNDQLIKLIRKEGKIAFMQDGDYCDLYSLFYNNNLYLDMQCKNSSNALFEQSANNRVYNLLLAGFFFFSFLVIFMYLSVLKSLEPLKKLRMQIAEVSNGKKPKFENYQDDEVGKIAFEFEKAFKKNQELIESRQLFLRTIMHELKTPIGKGRIITEMIKDFKQKDRLNDIFIRLDLLINEFAKMESLFSKNYNLNITQNQFSVILNEAKVYLMRDDLDKVINIKLYSDPFLNVDLEIFSLILKNMLDNALKYSDDGTCKLECYKDSFVIKNPGKELSQPIEYYFKAFSREKYEKVGGMGLGLYIVYEVCRLHNFELIYNYEKGKHCFMVFFGEKNKNGN